MLSPVSVVIYFRREVAHIEEFESHQQRHLKAALQPLVHTALLRLKTSQPRETRGFVTSSSGSVFVFFNGWHVDVGRKGEGTDHCKSLRVVSITWEAYKQDGPRSCVILQSRVIVLIENNIVRLP